MQVLQLPGLLSRAADSLPCQSALRSAPRSRSGSTLLNERAERRTTLEIMLEEARKFEKGFSFTPAEPPPAELLAPLQERRPPGLPSPSPVGMAPTPLELRARARLQGFLDQVETLREEQQTKIAQDNKDAVTLCSMHGRPRTRLSLACSE